MAKIAFDTYQIADISTKYITAQDERLLQNPNAPGHIARIDPVEGTSAESPGDILTIGDEDVFPVQIAELREYGFSDAFLNIIRLLHQQSVSYVRFDSDGGEIAGDLPIFSR